MARIGYVEIGGVLVPAWSEVGREELDRRSRVEAENLAWVKRLAPVVFGHYAWREGEIAVVKSAGSGIFVARRFGLSARHVSKSYEHLDDQFEAARRRFTPLDDKHVRRIIDGTKFSTLVYQLPPNYDGPGSAMGPLQWPSPDAADSHVDVDWSSSDTDVTTLQTTPTSAGACELEGRQEFFEWQMLPPPVGAEVRIFGMPGKLIFNHGEKHTVRFDVRGDVARVVDVSPITRDCGSWNFPGFTLDREFEFGMSGAPVFYEGALVGTFSGPDYVASLWPMALHTYLDKDRAEHALADLFEAGAIVVRDWSSVRGRVERRQCCDTGLADACSKEHVVLL